jgi:hypothetical protein
MRKMWLACLVVFALAGTLQAQEVVHAVSGVVATVNPAMNSMFVKTNDQSDGNFVYKKNLRADIEFDKSIRDGTVQPDGFNKVGDHVVIYYINQGAHREIVAMKDFGPSGLSVAAGTVVKSKHHMVTIKTDKGATQTFDIAKDSSAETSMGVVSGLRFDPDDGQRITVRYTADNGANTAQFIRAD